MAEEEFPSWRYGPDGDARVFQSAEEVPEGWVDHPSKAGAAPEPAAVTEAKPATATGHKRKSH